MAKLGPSEYSARVVKFRDQTRAKKKGAPIPRPLFSAFFLPRRKMCICQVFGETYESLSIARRLDKYGSEKLSVALIQLGAIYARQEPAYLFAVRNHTVGEIRVDVNKRNREKRRAAQRRYDTFRQPREQFLLNVFTGLFVMSRRTIHAKVSEIFQHERTALKRNACPCSHHAPETFQSGGKKVAV